MNTSTPSLIALSALALLAGSAQAQKMSSQDSAAAIAAGEHAPLAPMAGRKLVVVPTAYLLEADPMGWAIQIPDEKQYLADFDAELSFALADRGLKNVWVMYDKLPKEYKRNPDYMTDPVSSVRRFPALPRPQEGHPVHARSARIAAPLDHGGERPVGIHPLPDRDPLHRVRARQRRARSAPRGDHRSAPSHHALDGRRLQRRRGEIHSRAADQPRRASREPLREALSIPHKSMPKKTPVTLIPGDGIGPEITDATVRVLEAAGARSSGTASSPASPR